MNPNAARSFTSNESMSMTSDEIIEARRNSGILPDASGRLPSLPSQQERCPLDLTAMMAVLRPAMRIRQLGLCILFTAAIQSLCYGDVTKLPAEDRKALLDASRFHERHSAKDLPPAVVALCVDDKGKLADPGQNWNATDATTDPTLPWKRLIWAAAGNDYYVVHYERGGIDHSFHILVAKLTKNDGKPKVVWHGVGHQLKDYTAFLDALRTGKLDDRVDYPR